MFLKLCLNLLMIGGVYTRNIRMEILIIIMMWEPSCSNLMKEPHETNSKASNMILWYI
jgi:hypothetical protein